MNETDTDPQPFWERIGPYSSSRNKLALAMFVVLLLSYVLNAADRQLFSIVATDARADLDLSVAEIGLATTFFTLGMGLAALPTGYLLARVKRKTVVLLGLAIFSAAIVVTAYAQGLADLLLYRFILGVGESMQLTALLAIATTYFVKYRVTAASSLNFTFGIGALIGPNIGGLLLDAHDWRVTLISFGLSGIPIFILVFFLAKTWFTEHIPSAAGTLDSQHIDENKVESAPADAEEQGASSIFEPAPLMLAGATVFTGLAIYGYLGLYPTYLQEQLDFSGSAAGFAVSLFGLGAMLSLVGGWLGDKFDYRIVLAVALVIAAITGYLLFTPISALGAQAVLSFIYGTTASGGGYAVLSGGIIKSLKPSLADRGSGLFITALYFPAAFAGYLLGTLADAFGWNIAGLIQITIFLILAAALALTAKTKVASSDVK